VVRERRSGDLELGLDLAGRHLAALPDQEEEDLQARQVRERLERLHMVFARLEPGERSVFTFSIYQTMAGGQQLGRMAVLPGGATGTRRRLVDELVPLGLEPPDELLVGARPDDPSNCER